jgi:hypothetical protein
MLATVKLTVSFLQQPQIGDELAELGINSSEP